MDNIFEFTGQFPDYDRSQFISSDICMVAVVEGTKQSRFSPEQHYIFVISLQPCELSITSKTTGENALISVPYSITLLCPHSEYEIVQQDETEYLFICIDKKHVEDVLYHGFDTNIAQAESLFDYKNPRVSNAAQGLIEYMKAPHCAGSWYIDSMVTMLLTYVLSANARQAPAYQHVQPFKPKALGQVLTAIDSMLVSRTTIEKLAAQIGMSSAAFYRTFKTSTGQSPYQYVLERRISKARELLVDTSLTLAETAYECGFSSQSHMTDVFRQKLGITPGKLRKNSRSK